MARPLSLQVYVSRELAERAQAGDLRHRRRHVQRDGALGHVGGVVADALDVGRDAQGGVDLAQVARHRLAQGQQAQHVVADLVLERVDGLVVGDHAHRGLGVAALQHVDGGIELGDGDLAHADDFAVEPRELVVVTFDDVVVGMGHGGIPQPNRPVM